VGEALRAFTRGSAFVTYEEAGLGSIEPGKYADFLVLERDLTAIPVAEVKELKPVMTVVGGITRK
jgi:predicted amidohydrolase YtcJ